MSKHADTLRFHLAQGPLTARQLIEKMGISQPTLSRVMAGLATEVVRLGNGPSIQYALRDSQRGVDEVPVYRVTAEGHIQEIGTLIPVREAGFVMRHTDGQTAHSESLPWWLHDMRPQGFLGRAYAARYAPILGLPAALNEWSDTHVLRALLAHGHDMVGNLLLGNRAREHFLTAPLPSVIETTDKASRYAELATEATRGELPGSSAGGEQPKFTTYVQTYAGLRHVIVKFTAADDNPISQRWRDLLLAEHLALQTLSAAGIPAAATDLLDSGTQRFLEIQRFDRIESQGRQGLFSLAALDAEFAGAGTGGWAAITQALARAGIVQQTAAEQAQWLQAFGILIGNSDMHSGNLSFMANAERPYALAPAYDMLPMAFAPRLSGSLPDNLPPATFPASIAAAIWHSALPVAQDYLQQLQHHTGFSPAFTPCLQALTAHITQAATTIARIAPR